MEPDAGSTPDRVIVAGQLASRRVGPLLGSCGAGDAYAIRCPKWVTLGHPYTASCMSLTIS